MIKDRTPQLQLATRQSTETNNQIKTGEQAPTRIRRIFIKEKNKNKTELSSEQLPQGWAESLARRREQAARTCPEAPSAISTRLSDV